MFSGLGEACFSASDSQLVDTRHRGALRRTSQARQDRLDAQARRTSTPSG
jgi:hypothetical protein